MVKQQTKEGLSFDIDSKKPKRKYEVLEDGKVKMTETQVNVLTFDSREFITYFRQYEVGRDTLKNQLSKEYIKLLEKNLKVAEGDISVLDPIKKESEEKAKIHYEKLKDAAMVGRLKEELKKPKSQRNFEYLYNVYSNFNKIGIYDKYLTNEEKSEWVKIKLELMKRKRTGKKAAKRQQRLAKKQ